MKTLMLFLCAVMCTALTPVQAQVSWQFANGPWYAVVEDFSVGLKNGSVVFYAADSVDTELAMFAFVLRSTTSGESWQKLFLPAVGIVTCVATSSTDADIVYAGVRYSPNPNQDGIWKSTNGGASWNRLTNQPANSYITRIAVHRTNPDIVWVGCQDFYDEPSQKDTGLYIFYGRDSLQDKPDLLLRGSGSSVAGRVASLGDVNGDGYNDVITGNTREWGGLGEVLLYLGHRHMNGEFDVGWTGFGGDCVGTGQAVAWCGDVNGDGLNNIMFSSYDPNWPTRNGRVDIFGGDTSLVVAVKDNNFNDNLPEGFQLYQNYPNPFNSSTSITYSTKLQEQFTLRIFNMNGQEVKTIFRNMIHNIGEYTVSWDGTDNQCKSVSSGIYFYRLESKTKSITRKMILIH